jgi:hypothetical protein
MPAEHNGFLDETKRTIQHIGSLQWQNIDSGQTIADWDNWTSWVTYTGSAYLGAPGTPLRYRTEIIDLGSSISGYVTVAYNAVGTIRVVIESSDSSDMSSATFQSQYTNDNTATGTVQTHTVLDYYEEGYCDQTYGAFTGRYLRITAFIENFTSSTERGIPELGQFNWEVKTDTVTEQLDDVSVSGEAHTLSFTKIGVLTNIIITPVQQSNKKLAGEIVSKANKTIRIVDNNAFNVTGQTATADILAKGITSNLGVDSTGIHLEE